MILIYSARTIEVHFELDPSILIVWFDPRQNRTLHVDITTFMTGLFYVYCQDRISDTMRNNSCEQLHPTYPPVLFLKHSATPFYFKGICNFSGGK